jgi:MscS family membrane protein
MVRTVAEDGGDLARSFVPLFARVIKIGVWAMVVIVALGAAGVEVMGLVAGLGIGGLAVAFAAQKTIENFFGALAIAADRPFQKNNFVDIGGTKGTVEAVGLRSTRLRTSARTVVTIPNASIMTAKVENVSVRDRILFNPTIGLVYGSTRAQIELVVDELKKLLANHPKVFKDSFRVRMTGFGPSSIDIGILSWIDTTDYNEYTAVVEELNLDIMGIVEKAGTGFAFPSQTLYLGRDSGADEKLAAAAEEEVAARRAAGELWIPEPPGEV